MPFYWKVYVDGSDVAPLTLTDATLDFGRESTLEQRIVPTAYLQLLTRDAYPDAAEDYPEFGLGDWAEDLSGFVDVYGDEYEGANSRITIGASVAVDVVTPGGFTDEYVDEYGGFQSRRFTGHVQAIDYRPGTIALTCTPKTEQWSRALVGGTKSGQTIPVEYDDARAKRYALEAGFDLIVDGPPSVQLCKVVPKTAARPLSDHLIQIASDTGGVVYTNRDGWVVFQTRDFERPTLEPVTFPPSMTLLDPLHMTLELGAVRNKVTVEYGPPDAQPDRAEVIVTDQEQIDRYGLRQVNYSTIIETQADATAWAQWLMDQLSPAWSMPGVELNLSLGTEAEQARVCDLVQGDPVVIPQLPLGAPTPTYEAQVLGWSERMSETDWRITYHLSPYLRYTVPS